MRDPSLVTSPPAATASAGVAGQPATPPNADRLLNQCREMAIDRLGKSLTAMLDKVEETLWSMAESTTDREERDLYMQAKDQAKAQRAAIEDQFRKRFESEFEERAGKQSKKGGEETPQEFDLSNLTLVDDDSLSESLKVKDLASKMRGKLNDELRALDQRIGVLLKDPELKDADNPLSPDSIFSAFKQACDEMEAGLKVKMIILNLFDQQVSKEIQGIYKDINGLLIQNAVLPKIRFGVGRPVGGAAGMAAAAAAVLAGGNPLGTLAPGAAQATVDGAGGLQMPGMLPGMAGMAGMGGDAAMTTGTDQDFYSLLQGLLARQYGGMGGPAASMATMTGVPGGMGLGAHLGNATGPVQPLGGHELLSALTHLQQGDASVIPGVPNTLSAAIAAPGTVNILRDIKSTQFGKGIGEVDNMTFDIVALLFDQILEDKKIPDAMKALIGRLQIPILKVAILDKTFFQKKHHPARRMLNTLGGFGLGLGLDFDVNNPLFKQVEAILQKLIDQFEDDLSLFEKAEDELEHVIEAENRRAQEESARAARLLELREKLQVARATSQQEVKKRAESGQMPQAVLKFIAEEWIKLLVMAHAKAGPDSDAWRNATETMDQLIWSVSEKQASADRKKLTALLPVLLRRLQRGMQIIGTEEAVRNKFLAKLMRCHTKVINHGKEPVRRLIPRAPAPVAPASVALASTTPTAQPDPLAHPTPAPRPAAPAIPTLSDVVETEAAALETTLVVPQLPRGEPLEVPPAPVARETPLPDIPLPVEIGHDAQAVPGDFLPPHFEAAAGAAEVGEPEDDTRLSETLPSFKSMVIKNPFGDGEIEVEEISLDSLPAFAGNADKGDTLASRTGDEYSLKAGSMTVGTWIEIRGEDDAKVQARLSWISPLKGTYLFTNRHGAKVAEYSLYQLAKEMRMGNCTVMDEVPLFDRAMSSLVGALRKEDQ